MSWCPKCKYEYREGIAVCADCGCELVDDLSLVEDINNEPENEFIDEGLFFGDDIENNDEASDSDEFKLELDEEENDVLKHDPYFRRGVYVNNEEKAEENRTSAYTLIVVGIIGIVIDLLFFIDVISVNMTKFNKYMVSGVMGAMFILFLVMGIVSLRNFKIFKQRAKTENNLTNNIREWCLQNLNQEDIDNNFDFKDVPDELKYFQRFSYVKEKINSQFLNLDDLYLDRLVEELYSDIFEKEA